jgi:hypothetical protein
LIDGGSSKAFVSKRRSVETYAADASVEAKAASPKA